MRRWIAPIAAVIVATTAGLVVPAAAGASPHCSITWGSLPESHDEMSQAPYVPTVQSDGSGAVIPVRGGAKLQVSLLAPAHDADYNQTFLPANRNEVVNVAGWRTFRQVVFAGTYEGVTTLGLGVRARLPFRVFALDGPGSGSRIVIDIAHSW